MPPLFFYLLSSVSVSVARLIALISSSSAFLISSFVAALAWRLRMLIACSSAALTMGFGRSTLVAMVAPFMRGRLSRCVLTCNTSFRKCLR